ncbi:MAG: glycosyltransferase [Eubacteriales bacterium]
MLPISVCIIAKDEEETIQACLESLKPYNFEIIVVDTGSTDQTKLIAKRFTEYVYDFEWIGDFSAARNFSISKATNNWILIIDCDETIKDFDVKTVSKFLKQHPKSMGCVSHSNQLTSEQGEVTHHFFELERIFHRNYYQYEGIIHETVVPIKPKTTPPTTILLPITMLHSGYDGSDIAQNKKTERNITLLQQSVDRDPNNTYHQFQLARSFVNIKKYPEAMHHYDIALSQNPPSDILYTKLLYIDYAELLHTLERTSEAIQFLEKSTEAVGDFADAAYILGSYYYKQNNAVNAILNFIRALNCPIYSNQSYKTVASHYMLGLVYEQLGDHKMAHDFYKNCMDYKDTTERVSMLRL